MDDPGVHRWRHVVRAAAWLAAALLISAGPAHADDTGAWQLRHEDPQTDTRVWTRERAGAVPEFRATTSIEARLSTLAAVLLDNTRTREWVFRAREAVVLSSDGPNRGVTLVVTDMPPPLSDRESIVAWEMAQDPQTLTVTLAGHSVPDRLPPNPKRVRMQFFESRWQLTPRAGGRVDVLFEGFGDPGGNLAQPLLRWFVNGAISEAPWQTIKALRGMVKRPPFPQAELPFIREPAP